MNQGEKVFEKSDEDKTIQFLINQFGKTKILEKFTNQQIHSFLKQRGLIDFLLNITSAELLEAAGQREQIQQLEAKNKQEYRINILDLTVKELLKHCQGKGLFLSNNSIYSHKQLGTKLISMFPEKYYIGSKSHHFNRSREIQAIYGIGVNHYNKDLNQQDNQQDISGSDFINDQEQLSNYQEEEFHESNEQDEQSEEESEQIVVRKKKQKKIKKEKQKPVKKLNVPKRTGKITDFMERKESNNYRQEQIFMEDDEEEENIDKYEIKLGKTSEKLDEQKKQINWLRNKRNIDSD